jgi:hypothetical protein
MGGNGAAGTAGEEPVVQGHIPEVGNGPVPNLPGMCASRFSYSWE